MQRFGLLSLALALFVGSPALRGEPATDKLSLDKKKNVVVMETSMGTIELELYPAKAPITVKNFLDYVDAKFYDGTIFHRVIPKFMIQGGGFKPDLVKKKEGKPIKNEAGNGLSNVRGTIAMARTNNPDSATSQFFINVADNTRLDRNSSRNPSEGSPGYTVFGKVIKGMDVVDKISEVKTETAYSDMVINGKRYRVPFQNVPVKDVIIKSVRRKK